MPVEIRAYACQFRCGRIWTKAVMVSGHEKTCFKNPERRACKTCRNYRRGGEEGCWCAIEENGAPDYLGTARMDGQNNQGKAKDFRWNCPGWEGRS